MKKLATGDVNRTASITYLILHHAVINTCKKDKTRVFFDAAVKWEKISLNDILLKRLGLLNRGIVLFN